MTTKRCYWLNAVQATGERPTAISLREFLTINSDSLSPTERRRIAHLKPGQFFDGGGWTITRRRVCGGRAAPAGAVSLRPTLREKRAQKAAMERGRRFCEARIRERARKGCS